jgi:heme/copper-type cytochrome/quinol oxidase subunit 3
MSEVALERQPLPSGSIGTLANGYWGMMGLILTEGALFAYLLFSYYYHAVQPHSGQWPPDGAPSLSLALPDTILLIASSVVVWWGEQGTKNGVRWKQLTGLGVGVLMGIGFIAIQGIEWHSKTFTLSSGPYGSLFFTITGFHMAHVVVGVLALLAVTVWSSLGYFGPVRSAPVTIAAIYWHFVDAVWIVVFFTFYLTPRLGLIWHGGGS